VTLVSRRTVLYAGAAFLVVGCTAEDDQSRAERVPSPDELLRRAVAADESRLLEMYAATQLAHPDLAELVTPFVRRHQEHLQAVGGAVSQQATPTPTSSATPGDRATTLGRLAEAEAAAARTREADCLRAADGELARLLASIAACESLHEPVVAQL
jgi:hypothetical protein